MPKTPCPAAPAAILALSATLAGPAHADWQNTRWGMSAGEIEGLAGIRPATPELGFDSESQEALYAMDYTAAGIATLAAFLFARDDRAKGLAEVQLRVADSANCAKALGRLRATYGEEESADEGSLSSYHVWMPKEHGNRIVYMKLGGDYCSVTYQPILDGNTPGNF
ncbi:hypothetical protein OEZ60_07350 [Defluviimonas sp. WL0024]|uniref:Uncharacterized protein n=1 Tax=Albidovulum salinarum TaxID=2984153 RepID=A0ABT2X2G8_9RHOB|nr:hypothetical protein [Defluviimonas sp. WL0024]MCU9847820.1 hypothetical protein [Defluviimonas sp. WL0024]